MIIDCLAIEHVWYNLYSLNKNVVSFGYVLLPGSCMIVTVAIPVFLTDPDTLHFLLIP